MMDEDDDFPSTSTGTRNLDKIRPEMEKFGRYLAKKGYCYHIFVTPKEAKDISSIGAMMPAAAAVSMNVTGYISHVMTLLGDKHYRKAGIAALLLLRQGKLKVKDFSSDNLGKSFLGRLKDKLSGGDDE
jgi:hypothetical protein